MYEKDRQKYLEARGKWSKNLPVYLMLNMTYRCNRRCSFCYCQEQIKKTNIIDMSDKVVEDAGKWIVSWLYSQKVNYLPCAIVGGEPSLVMDKTAKLSKYILDNKPEFTRFLPGLFTNGDNFLELDPELFNYIYMFSYHISDTSIEEAKIRIDYAKKFPQFINKVLVATLDYNNLNRIEDITRLAMDNGFRMRYYRNCYSGNDEEYKDKFLSSMHKCVDILENYKSKGYHVPTGALLDVMIPYWNSENSPYSCGNRIVVIHPDGSVHACTRNFNSKIGDIWSLENPLRHVNEFWWDYHRPDIHPDCLTCEVNKVCHGGCPNDRMITYGTYAGKSPFCKIYKEILPRLRDLTDKRRP